MRERRAARVGTISGLALLAGGTAVAAVSGSTHSIFTTTTLGLLAITLSHSLLKEIRRQAQRKTPGWAVRDTVNAVLLGCWAIGALIMTVLAVAPVQVRALGALLFLGYALTSVHFVSLRRRSATAGSGTPPIPAISEPASPLHSAGRWRT